MSTEVGTASHEDALVGGDPVTVVNQDDITTALSLEDLGKILAKCLGRRSGQVGLNREVLLQCQCLVLTQ